MNAPVIVPLEWKLWQILYRPRNARGRFIKRKRTVKGAEK